MSFLNVLVQGTHTNVVTNHIREAMFEARQPQFPTLECTTFADEITCTEPLVNPATITHIAARALQHDEDESTPNS